jgi:hypothetical protein
MPICKKTIEYRKINDLCPRCGKPNINGKSLCQKHLDEFAAKALKYRHIKINKGLCPECGGLNKENQYCCDICKEKNKPKHQRYFKKRYKYTKENSICFNCGKNQTINNKTRCEECSSKYNEINKQEYKKLLKNKLCVICGKNQVENKTYCEECIQKRGEWYKESNTRIKNKIEREKIKNIVFEHYGNKCIVCAEKDIDVLVIDHINNDGYKQRKQTGEGASFYKWIKENNFPIDLQILCCNCNIKKYKQALSLRNYLADQQKLNEDPSMISDGVPTREKKDEILAN